MSQCYRQLRLHEREVLFRLKAARLPVRQIAAELGRHPSTLYRELRRNFFYDEDPYFRGYFPAVAHKLARERRAPGRKLERRPELASYVVDRLQSCWSPEQIAGRLRLAGHGRGGRKPRGLKIPVTNGIGQRPPTIARRDDFGHWEGDLVAFRQVYGKSNLTSLVERKSRFAVLWRNPSRSSAGVMAGICGQLGPLPSALRQSVTFDRGTEFAAFPTLQSELGMSSYFCEPKSPWQKGGVENFNGRLRRYLPSDTDIAAMDASVIQAICAQLNSTPRKCLGFRTPLEVFAEERSRHGK